LRLKRRHWSKVTKSIPLDMTVPLVMTAPFLMRHSRRLNSSPTVLKNKRASMMNHTKYRQSTTATQNRTRNILLLLLYAMLLCLY
jgi:hypothetical protein